jgi:hypothetical protein
MDSGSTDLHPPAAANADSDAMAGDTPTAPGTLPRPHPDPAPDTPTEPPSPAPTDPAQPLRTFGGASEELSRLRSRGRSQSRVLSETLRRLDDLLHQISQHQISQHQVHRYQRTRYLPG